MYVGVHLREVDRREVERSTGDNPVSAPLRSVQASIIAWTLLIDGVPAACFGVAPDKRDHRAGVVWLLGTPAVHQAAYALVRSGKYYVSLMKRLYPVLHNMVDAENTTSLAWLKALGFEQGPYACESKSGHPFLYVFHQEPAHV